MHLSGLQLLHKIHPHEVIHLAQEPDASMQLRNNAIYVWSDEHEDWAYRMSCLNQVEQGFLDENQDKKEIAFLNQCKQTKTFGDA